MRRVAVVFGGQSCENEISVLTGVFVARLLSETYEILPLYVHTDGKTYSSPKMTDLQIFKDKAFDKCDRVFLEGGELFTFIPSKRFWGRWRRVRLDGTKRHTSCFARFNFVRGIHG